MNQSSSWTAWMAAVLASALLILSGCAVSRGQQSVGEYLDDSVITTKIKSEFAKDKEVDATSISVETLKGVVVLSGFARNLAEKAAAERIALKVKGVTHVKNAIEVR
ncbi:MAG TPA: BON domain-containing protein [Burkholderiaceae bacterium]|nr:BON domain-containing protein [Burkholderiaceae bacterium]